MIGFSLDRDAPPVQIGAGGGVLSMAFGRWKIGRGSPLARLINMDKAQHSKNNARGRRRRKRFWLQK